MNEHKLDGEIVWLGLTPELANLFNQREKERERSGRATLPSEQMEKQNRARHLDSSVAQKILIEEYSTVAWLLFLADQLLLVEVLV